MTFSFDGVSGVDSKTGPALGAGLHALMVMESDASSSDFFGFAAVAGTWVFGCAIRSDLTWRMGS